MAIFRRYSNYTVEIDLDTMLKRSSPWRLLALPVMAAALHGVAGAAELGEVSVKSYRGQQLVADIDLVDLTPADLADLQVRLANPDVFKGANLSMHPALSGMYLSVARHDARRVLHLTTLQPINSDVLHIFVELTSGGRQIIRAATLWLAPEPPAARSARIVPEAAPVAVAKPAAAPAPAVEAVAEKKPAPVPAVAADKPAVASPAPAARAEAHPVPAAPSVQSNEAELNAAAERAFAARKQAPRAAPAAPACSPALIQEKIQQCQAMADSNKVLTTKLVDLEVKVKRLQSEIAAPAVVTAKPGKGKSAAEASVGEPPASMASAVASAAPKAAEPAAHPVPPKPAASHPAKLAAQAASTAPEESAAPNGKKLSRPKLIMLIAGGAIAGLAALGALVHFLRKRQAKGPLKIWQSFRKKGAQAEAQEPVLEEAAEAAAQE